MLSVVGLQDYVPGWNGFSPAFLVQFFIDNPDLFEEFAVRIGSTIKVSQEALLRIWLRLSWAAARKRIATLPQAPAAYTEDVACLLRQLQFRQFGDELHCLPNTDQLIWHFRVVSWATEYAQLLDHRVVPIIEQVYQFVSERKGTGRVLIRRMSDTLAITAAGFKIVNDHIVHLGNGQSTVGWARGANNSDRALTRGGIAKFRQCPYNSCDPARSNRAHQARPSRSTQVSVHQSGLLDCERLQMQVQRRLHGALQM